jgi:hypothetical protein
VEDITVGGHVWQAVVATLTARLDSNPSNVWAVCVAILWDDCVKRWQQSEACTFLVLGK